MAQEPPHFAGPYPNGVDVSLSQPTAVAPYNDRFQIRYGSGLTPTAVTGALNSANIGYMYQLADMLDELRETDPHLHAVLFKREWQVAGAPLDIHAEDVGSPEDVKIAEFCSEKINCIPHFTDALAHLQGAHYYGRALLDCTWGDDGKYFVPIRFDAVHPRRLSYSVDWNLHLWDQTGNQAVPKLSQYPGIPLWKAPPGKWIVHTPRVRGGYPTREGLGRLVVWYSMYKRWAWRDWMALAEWAGRGFRIGTFNSGMGGEPRATPEDVAVLERAMQHMSSTVTAVVPDTTKLQIVSPQRQNTIHQAIQTAVNAEMSKAVLGNTLTTDAGEKGARSLGDNQSDEQAMIASGDARTLCETLRWSLLAPMVRYNFGPKAKIPIATINVKKEESLNELAARIKMLVEAGADVTQAWVQETFGLPTPAPGEPLLTAIIPQKVQVPGANLTPSAAEAAAKETAKVDPNAAAKADPTPKDNAQPEAGLHTDAEKRANDSAGETKK